MTLWLLECLPCGHTWTLTLHPSDTPVSEGVECPCCRSGLVDAVKAPERPRERV